MEWFLNQEIWDRLQEQLEEKQDAPETAGTVGQVLGLANRDGQLVPVWITVSGGGVTIDDALSPTSENPVQNKVITISINDINQDLEDLQDGLNGKVDDVQVNGTSVVQDGVANVPIGSADDVGVVKKQLSYGIDITSSGQLILIEAADNDIKRGYTGARRAIFTGNQHKSAFYALAKAAGDATQSTSTNPVGQYTDDAKTAILSMLGVLLKRQSVSVSLTINHGDQALVSIPNMTGYVPVFTRLFFTSATGASHKLCVSGLIYQSSENRVRIFNTETSGSVTFTGDLQVYYLPVTAFEEVI